MTTRHPESQAALAPAPTSTRDSNLNLRTSILCLIAIALLGGCRGPTPRNAERDREVRTSDEGAVDARCESLSFVVSLNHDDDDGDGMEDRRGPLPAAEDNLRKFVFNQPGASEVFVGEPVLLAGGGSALGTRVRAWEQDKATPFDFTRKHALPATLYLEGVEESAQEGDFGFEYQYFGGGDVALCGGASKGIVVKVRMTFSSLAPSDTKLLAQGRISMSIVKTPNVQSTYTWSYDGDGTFASASRQTTRFTAGNAFTPAQGSQLVRCNVTFETKPPGTILVTSPLDITAPRSVAASSNGELPAQQSNVIKTQDIRNVAGARRTEFGLLNYDVDYTILDQFGAPIVQSERGGAHVTAREDVPLRSAIPAGIASLQAFFDEKIPTNTSINWRNQDDGVINDNLRLGPRASTILRLQAGQLRFIPNTIGADVVTMDGHEWFVSVNGDPALAQRVTNNSLRTTVIDFQQQANGESVQFSTTYTVRTNP